MQLLIHTRNHQARHTMNFFISSCEITPLILYDLLIAKDSNSKNGTS